MSSLHSFHPLILDTDIFSALMRKNPLVVAKSKSYLTQHNTLAISVVTRYEILRGLLVKNATSQISAFEFFCKQNQLFPITDDIIDLAANIYADLYRRGLLVGDADILIAASAMANGFGVVTNNMPHFARISGLHVENWLT